MSYLQQDLDLLSKYIFEQKFNDKSFLITGATGLVGSLIIKSIITCNKRYGANIKVYATARSQSKVNDVFSGFDIDDVKFLYQDLEQKIDLERVDYVVHTACPTVSKYFISNPVETIKSICLGSMNVLDYAKANKVDGVVYLSSMEAFGTTEDSLERLKEKDLGYIDLCNVRSCYSESKRLVECMCKCYAEQYGVSVRVARLAQTFGAGITKSENRVFAQFARSAINKTDIVLHTKGDSVGNYCYTTDAIKAILLLLNCGISGDAYTVVNENTTMSIKEMAEMVIEKIAKGQIKLIFDIPEGNQFGYAPKTGMRLSAEKLRALGWRPTIDLDEAYIRMMESL